MTSWLRIALAAQLLFFAGWGARLLTSHRDVGVVWLATEPVDPRDLLSGHYVALRYAIASAATGDCELPSATRGGTPVWIMLAPSSEPIETVVGMVVPSEAVTCSLTPPEPGAGDVWIRGELDQDGRIVYRIERMYVAEEDPRREARSGSVVAKVLVNDAHEPRLVDLVPKTPAPAEAAQ